MIYLLPLGFEDDKLFDAISRGVKETFGISVRILPMQPIPEHACNEARGQYHSTAILRALATRVPSEALRLLAVTDKDLFIPQLNFVFGEAAVSGQVCIISVYRLRPEYYGKPPNEDLFIERAIKEAVHELGHTFGLRHCRDPKCVMFFSNDIEDTDRKSVKFCRENEILLSSVLDTLKAAA